MVVKFESWSDDISDDCTKRDNPLLQLFFLMITQCCAPLVGHSIFLQALSVKCKKWISVRRMYAWFKFYFLNIQFRFVFSYQLIFNSFVIRGFIEIKFQMCPFIDFFINIMIDMTICRLSADITVSWWNVCVVRSPPAFIEVYCLTNIQGAIIIRFKQGVNPAFIWMFLNLEITKGQISICI